MKKTTLKNLNHSKKKESLRQQSIISQTIKHKLFNQKLVLDLSTNQYQIYLKTYWVVRKVCADFKGKLKRRRLNFSISLLNYIGAILFYNLFPSFRQLLLILPESLRFFSEKLF